MIEKICLFLFVALLNICSANSSPIDKDLPTFIIIGAQKSGTGAFYELLRQHPLIVDRPGEIHFFDLYFDRGVQWYKDQFPKSKHPDAIRGDKSPYYLFHPLAPERAYFILPKAKLIVLLRNPVDRAYSQYWMNVRKGREFLSFEQAILAESNRLREEEEKIINTKISSPSSNHRRLSYLSRGLYINQLNNWLKYYPLDQILIISFDDFLKNPEAVLQETLKFLELPPYYNFRFNIGTKHEHPNMAPSFRQELADYFRPYNEQLETLLHRTFNWE